MKIQSPRQRIVAAVGAVAIALATAGASQAGAVGGPEYGIVRISQATGVGDDQGKLVIGFNMTVGLTAPNATGTFVAAGAVNDSGASTATVTLTPSANNLARKRGTHTLTGVLGTITIRFRRHIFPFSMPHEIGITRRAATLLVARSRRSPERCRCN